MKSSLWLFWVLVTLAIVHIVQAQDQQGFISLDCGLPANEMSPYIDINTGLRFSSDKNFIQSGKTGKIGESPEGVVNPYGTLRYFPDGIRNCYNLNVEKGLKYLIKASFVYGNYDGHDIKPVFDLYLGPNLWEEIDLRQVNSRRAEILHIPTSNSLQICLVKTGITTPLISSLELRPMGNASYITQSGSLNLFFRRYYNESKSKLRYRKDVYDRIWVPLFMKEWTQISTTHEIRNSNHYVPAEDALRNAATPTNPNAPLTIKWTSENPDDQYYLYAHFAEIQDLQANETREFNMMLNGEFFYGPLIPTKLVLTTIQSHSPKTCDGGECNFQLTRTNKSTLPPLLNAFEVYTVIQFPQSETNQSDVVAMKNIAASYGLSRINWQGDPCVPEQLRWDALNCSNTDISIAPRITTLNLSSSALNGTIAAPIENLTQLEKLDLSNNNLTGVVPEFLGNMKSLSVINLTGNNLNGLIPQALRREGLELLVEGNPRLCFSDPCRKPSKKKFPVAIVASVTPAAIVIVVLVLFLVFEKKKSRTLEGIARNGLDLPQRTSTVNNTFANMSNKRFTYSEVLKMTNNFQRVLGKGGFGMVYHGTVDGSEQVAVKVLSQSSTQGEKQFKAEVDLLLRVHHTNLVSLVGYCYEGDHLALIYEFLPNGDLKQHLLGKRGRPIINWTTRLRIALETALGLEYLHIGCKPPMVHRDVKTANILLDENFKAKLADFGLSRSFQVGGESQDSTVIAGTPGYLDPEYHRTSRLAVKSDVYSYGIVLLKMITNQPVISEKYHIAEWVRSKLNRGDITEIMDPNLHGVYDSNSAWRALELAMSCADPSSSKRPTMSQVINELKECIVCENSRMSKNPGLESQGMNICLDTSVVPAARYDVNNSNNYEPPKDALATAAVPTNASEPLTIRWTNSDNPNVQYYVYIHFAEIQELQSNDTRVFNAVWNGEVIYRNVIPPKFSLFTVYDDSPRSCDGGDCSFRLIRTNNSTLPPLLNALEVFTVIQFPQTDTYENDVVAIKSIKDAYELNSISWQGDPCVPQHLTWDGLKCGYTNISTPLRITSLNLSSTGLTGTIAGAIQNLTQLETLDLSNNSLIGELPEFLGNIKSLLFINLSGNDLNGSIPQPLQKKGLELLVEGNPRLCVSDSCKKPPKKAFPVPVVGSVASAAIIIALLVLFLVIRKNKSEIVEGHHHLPLRTSTVNVTFATKKSKRFTYSEVIKMTNNFQRALGKGGFGMVYHGTVNGSEQVAVKVLSQSSTQGYNQFKAEVDLLLRVHHTNLVGLVGYCYEGEHLVLIYELLPNGDLKQHLAEKGGRSIISWSTRLRIALEAALGLEYLHIGCTPPMVHRDIKTANILLDENFKAKLADFGLSRSFQVGSESQHLTLIAGTPGYFDPEYYRTGQLAEKSDVYSFGVMLLEMITNQPVINKASESTHIIQWVGFKLNRGDIIEIMDPNLRQDYDSNSAWRALELAMSCADPSSSKRPTMSQVVQELKECVCENAGISKNRGLELEETIISLDTSVAPNPMAR